MLPHKTWINIHQARSHNKEFTLIKLHSYMRLRFAFMLTLLSLYPLISTAQKGVFDEMYDSFDEDEVEQPPGQLTQRATSRLRCTASDDAVAELDGLITLYFLDAKTGQAIQGATVTLDRQSAKTSAGGCVRLPKPTRMGDLMDTKLTAHFKAKGYITFDAQLHFMSGTLFFNRFSVSKQLTPGRLRVVLDWADAPRDLDAHLVREGMYHISYRKMRSYQDRAGLDRDDRDGYGPETITIEKLDPTATYRFYVQDYTRSGSMGEKSKAHVRVYTERGLEQTFTIPRSLRGDRWAVFELRKGQLIPAR